jgi:uncharacterized damage-inducible protein DinB
MSNLENVRKLIAYDRTVFQRYENAVHKLGWKRATEEHATGHLSLKNTLVHILNVREAWFLIIPERRWKVFDETGRQPNEIRSWAEYRRYSGRVWSGVTALTDGLTESTLARPVKAPWMPGKYTFEDAVYQTSYEQAHHLGEIIAVFWQADRAPPKMTWIENRPAGRRGARRRK